LYKAMLIPMKTHNLCRVVFSNLDETSTIQVQSYIHTHDYNNITPRLWTTWALQLPETTAHVLYRRHLMCENMDQCLKRRYKKRITTTTYTC